MAFFGKLRFSKDKTSAKKSTGKKSTQSMLRNFESLEDRNVMAVTASFNPVAGILTVFGDALNNTIEVSRNAAGSILVNGGSIKIIGGTSTVANTKQIQMFGQEGNDILSLNEANGALPASNLFGGNGNDVLTGGSGSDQLFGQAGNDTLLGKGGSDLLFGGSENDVLTGGDADDQVFGEAGDDRMIWNPGDDTDLNEGGAGTDTIEVNGGNGAETFSVTANGTRVRVDRLTPAPFSIDVGTAEKIAINMNGGDDSFSATGNLAALAQIIVDGGTGNDTLLGSNGNDTLLGGDGNDFIDGNQGNDVALMGAGDDTFQWDPGDGSDVVEGQAGTDIMVFNGSNIAENIDTSANGERIRLTRNVGAIVMDINDVERLDLNALGGADVLSFGDLSGTDLTLVNINLGGTLGGATGDAAADSVIVSGTNGNDIIDVFGSGTSYAVLGLQTSFNVTNSEGANDSLTVKGLGGNDGMSAPTLPAGVVKLTMDGGIGDDNILGSQGADFLFGGDGYDYIEGNQGDDAVFMGAGDDEFQWEPGDGSDIVEGQEGTDRLFFFGSNASENFDISANGGRVRFTRDVAAITMDLNDVETIEMRALGGADSVVLGDMTGTDLTSLTVDLRGPNGGGDGAADKVTINGTQGADVFGVAGDSGGISVFGLQTHVNIFDQEVANDSLTLNGQGGDDVMNAASLEADGIMLTMNGGSGNDTMIGSEGNDSMNGGSGNDVLLMGLGDDTFTWNPGDGSDIVEGQDGFDTMVFNGANISENFDLSANGERLRMTRNVANITMDVNDVEDVVINTLGGADTIVVNDLSGTDVVMLDLKLAATGGAGDGQADTVIVNATNGDDVLLVAGDATGVSVSGLSTQINITGAEAANDRLVLNALGGNDVIEASGLAATGIQLVGDGGAGDDVLIGGDGNDTLLGGAGDDVLIGGPGQDVLDGGTGDNVVIQ